MSSGVPYIRFFGDDWLSGTQDLSLDERGVLVTLVAMTAATGKPPKADFKRLARRFCCSPAKAEKLIMSLVKMEKLQIDEGEIINTKALDEVELSQDRSAKQAQKATSRWRQDREKNQNSVQNQEKNERNFPGNENGNSPKNIKNANKINDRLDATALPQQVPRQCQPEPEPDIKKGSPVGDHKKSGLTDRNLSADQATAQPPPPQPTPLQAVRSCRSEEKPPPRDKRGTRLSEDWEPGEKELAFARDLEFSEREITDMAASFRDYWIGKPGKNAIKLDWSRTWNNWVRNDIKRHGPPGSRKVKNSFDGRVCNSFDAANAMQDAWERLERETATTIEEVPQ